jgi:hypothetical protein
MDMNERPSLGACAAAMNDQMSVEFFAEYLLPYFATCGSVRLANYGVNANYYRSSRMAN